MNDWMSFLWPMVTGACVTLGLINLRVAFGDRPRLPHVFFAFAAFSVAAVSWLELALMKTTELAAYQELLRWAALPLCVMVLAVTGFIWSFFGTSRAWLAKLVVVLILVAQVAEFASNAPAIRSAVSLRQVETFAGVTFTIGEMANGPWESVELVGIVALLLFVIDSSLSLWRKGERRRAAVVGGGVIFFLLASRGHAMLVEKWHLPTPYLVSFSFLGLLVAMGIELTRDVLQAATLSHELRESERRIDLAARAAALGFWAWDLERDELWANGAARTLFGLSQSEPLTFDRFIRTLHPDDVTAVQQTVAAAVAEEGEYEREYRVLLPDGAVRWIAARGKVETGARRMRGVVIDITDRRVAEAELQRLRSQLAHTGRVSMMGQLASALAHELNQPLGAILRNAEAAELFLQGASPDLDEVRAIIGDIRKDDQRAGDVIDRMRAMLKRRDLDFSPIHVADLLREVVTLARADAATRRVTLKVSPLPVLPPVLGDRVHLQQVLLNLLINAMDAMQEQPEGRREATLAAQPYAPSSVAISVSDTGSGIPADRLSQVFEPFFTTKPQGMGMGLAISHTIIVAHGGHLAVENNADGRGATFRFTLPVAGEGSPA